MDHTSERAIEKHYFALSDLKMMALRLFNTDHPIRLCRQQSEQRQMILAQFNPLAGKFLRIFVTDLSVFTFEYGHCRSGKLYYTKGKIDVNMQAFLMPWW